MLCCLRQVEHSSSNSLYEVSQSCVLTLFNHDSGEFAKKSCRREYVVRNNVLDLLWGEVNQLPNLLHEISHTLIINLQSKVARLWEEMEKIIRNIKLNIYQISSTKAWEFRKLRVLFTSALKTLNERGFQLLCLMVDVKKNKEK